MPRRREVPKREILPDPKFGNVELSKFMNVIMEGGKKAVAERIRIEISKIVVETEKGSLSVTESIGVAAFPEDGRERATLIERADPALYHAKNTGRNRVVTWAEAQSAKTKKAS